MTQFMRIGTCASCPITDGQVYPEFCAFTNRYDHNLDLDRLFEMTRIYMQK